MKTRLGTIFVLLCCLAVAQPALGTHVQQLYSTGSNLQYMCDAPANVGPTTVALSDGTLTNLVVSSNVGTVTTATDHNLWVGAALFISAPNTTALTKLYYIKTVPSSTTYTITTSGVSNGTYNNGGMSITTNSPRLNDSVWYVEVMHYNSTVLDGVYPGGGPLSLSYRAACSDRALY